MKRTRGMVMVVLLVLILWGAASAQDVDGAAQEIRLAPVADTFISSSNLLTGIGQKKPESRVNFGTNEGLSIIKGDDAGPAGVLNWRGTLIRFDLSGIPEQAEILEAQLFLYHYSIWVQPISIHRLQRKWEELEATWFEPCQGCTPWWSEWEGGNFWPAATSTRRVDKLGWFSWDVMEDVRTYLKATVNYGWFLKSAAPAGNDTTSVSFYSREAGNKDQRPYLRVRFRSSPRLTIKITSPENGVVLHENPVEVTGMVSDPSSSVTVNGVLPSVTGNTFLVSLNLAEGKNSIIATAQDGHGQSASDRIDVTLVTKGNVAGTVTDSSTGRPLSSAAASVTDSSNIVYTAWTGLDGQFSIASIASGPFKGGIKKDGYSSYEFTGVISPGQTTAIDAALSPIFPVIANLSVVDLSAFSATITWTTDQPADSLVEFGTTPSYGKAIVDPALTTSHRVTLGNLIARTTYHFRVTSTNQYGFSSASADNALTTSAPVNPITLRITFPAMGTTISAAYTRVEGVLINSAGNETGVMVGGIAAAVSGNRFVVNEVPLLEGANEITAIATDVNGNTASEGITCNMAPARDYLKLAAHIDSGIPPLETLLSIESSPGLEKATLDYEGPGEVEVVTTSTGEYAVKLAKEGIYNFTARATDTAGILYEDRAVVIVFSKEEVDAVVTAKWEGMRAKLGRSDIDGALMSFHESKKERYRWVFNALGPALPKLAEEMADIQLIDCGKHTAEYDLRTVRNGKTYSFQLLFIKDSNGLWKIGSF